jgi:hypothetical protein
MPCGYLERTRLIRLLRQLEISTCSRAGARADLRDRRRTVFPRDIDRGYNRVCRNGPRSRPSQPIAETFVQLPKTGNIAKAVPAKFVVSKNSRGGLQTSNLKPQLQSRHAKVYQSTHFLISFRHVRAKIGPMASQVAPHVLQLLAGPWGLF